MTWRFRPFAAVLAIAFVAGAGPGSAAETLPRLEADALGGTHVVLPEDANGRPLVMLIAYTRASGDQLKTWTRKLLDDGVASNAALYVVVVADRIALSSHRHIRSVIEGAAVGTREQVDRNVLVTFAGDDWRRLVPPGDRRTPGVVVCDPHGTVIYAKRSLFSPDAVAEVERLAR
jgi:hypothetical protein